MNEPNIKPLNIFTAVFPIICLIALFAVSLAYFKSDSLFGPNQIALFICAIIAIFIGICHGISFYELERVIVDGISAGLSACLILLFVGSLIGVWLASGTVATIIYYGCMILNAQWFYATTLIICAIVAMCIGSSWTTAATIGVAFIGICETLGLNSAITAGAIISGAYLGDKISPLSETTNLAAAVSSAKLFDHIRNMLWTTIPSFTIALIIFASIGLSIDVSEVAINQELVNELEKNFNISAFNLIPILILVLFSVLKFPALLTIFLGTIAGIAIALTNQTELLAQAYNHPEGIYQSIIDLWNIAASGFTLNTNSETINDLMSGGGMKSMLNTIFLIFAALCFGSAMQANGALDYIISGLLKKIKSARTLLPTTVLSCISMNMLTGDQYMSIAIPGRMFNSAYRTLNIRQESLSRSLEDGATITSVLIPWNSCSVYMSGIFGIASLEFIPYCFFNMINPIIAIIMSLCGLKLGVIKQNNQEIKENQKV